MLVSRTAKRLLTSLFLLVSKVHAVTLMVNEYSNENGVALPATKFTRTEYIEFVVGEASTAEQLAALTFGDTNNATSQIRSVFQFDLATLQQILTTSGQTEFLPGTVIVVKGDQLGPQDLTYNPLSSNTGDANAWNIELVAGQGARDHSETLINGSFTVDGSGDVVWVSTSNPPTSNTDTSGFISALGHDTTPGFIASSAISQFGSGVIWNGNVGTGSVVSNTGGSAGSTASVSTTGTRGTTNGGANDTWVTGLREYNFVTTVPEPSRAVLMLIGLSSLLLRRQRTRRVEP